MSFDLQPNLKGGLIQLRPLAPDDWENLFAVASDPLIWEQHPESDRYKEDVFRVFFREALESGGAFVIRRRNKSSDRRDSTITIRRNLRLKLDGPSWREDIGAGDITGK